VFARNAIGVFLLVSCASPALAQRLPGNVTPAHYDLAVTPDLQKATFGGSERIEVTLKAPARTITLNAAEIEFDTVTISAGGRTQRAHVTLVPSRDQATLTVPRVVPAGKAEIEINYRGILNDELRGLYLSKANNRRYAVTQLEATDARRMFPSFDEPAYKATFSLSATIDDGDHAISNGAVLSDTPGPGARKHTVKFETTETMSTYLVALAVGDFVCESGEADGVPIRICATPDKKGQTGLALEAAEQILRYYNRYYAVKYPFKKLDVVAVPDFAAGAMENTAAIFYRETLLLAEPRTASVPVRKAIALVLAHEMAHQWFGDLVTMRWWDDIWLNEGFANWMETKPLKAWKPEWHMELDEVQSNQVAMRLDALRSTRPIRASASTPDQINELFDPIAYEKGAAVLRMVEAWVGEDAFRAGVNTYIGKFQYSNARAEDFWGTLTASTGKPVDKVMATFVDQSGVPLVDTVVKCDAGGGMASVSQDVRQAARPRTWRIPVCVKAPSGQVACDVVGAPGANIALDTCPAWVMANADARGYYRVLAPADMIAAIAQNVASLEPAERIALLSDEWALVRAGRRDVGTFLDLGSGFESERNEAVLSTLVGALAAIGEELTTPKTAVAYRAWVARLLRPALDEVGWTPAPPSRTTLSVMSTEDEGRRELRAALVGALGEIARDPAVIAKAREVVLSELAKPGSVESTLLNAAVPVAALSGDAALYEQYLARSRAASDPEEQHRYMYALAAFSDPALVRRTMDYIAGPEVRTQDTKIFIARLLGNPDARQLAWELLQARWTDVQKKTGEFVGNIVIVGALGAMCGSRALADVKKFFAVHKVPDAERTLQQSAERIEACTRLAAAQSGKLAEWLSRH
jgi:aminopeptidase N